MGTITWRKNPSVKEAIEKETYTFDFDQAIYVLEKLNNTAVPLGEDNNPEKEAVIIKSRVSLSAPASELHSLEKNDDSKPTLWINFLSIAGLQGPLPTPYSETVIQRTRQKDTGFRDFLDIFNHRLASIWHRLRKKNTLGIAQAEPEKSYYGKVLARISGVYSDQLDKNDLNTKILLTYQDLLWRRARSTEGLKCLLESFFNIKVDIQSFKGKWRKAPANDLSFLGNKKGQLNNLGHTLILGKRCWDQVAQINIIIGPLKWQQYLSFIPIEKKTHDSYKILCQLCHFYTTCDVEINVKLILDKQEIKPLSLDRSCSLGLSSWLKLTGQRKHDSIVKIHLPLPFKKEY